MNKIKFIKLSALLICLFGLNIYGQRKEITKVEFFESYRNAGEKTRKTTYRVVSKNEVFLDNQLQSVQNYTDEFVPPDKKRFVAEIKSSEPIKNKYLRTERILIGNDEYKRENGGEWVKRTLTTTKKPANNNTSKTVENNSKYYLTENVNLGNQPTNLYELTVEYRHPTQTSPTNEGKEFVSYRKQKIWISRDGLYLRMEMEDEFPEPRKSSSRRTWIYEYDPNIKIEAPIK
jgi:hypothetical protein